MTDSNTYDELPYPNLAFPQTHPNRLAVIARLFGVTPPKPSTSRILELGCGPGGNVIAMGAGLPAAELVGVDLSQRHINEGQATLAATGLSNITLHQADITRIDESWGKFDYIIAHGLYSWVPSEVQTAILNLSRKLLSPNGIAYVSYNTNPGWRIRSILRDMMLFHTGRITGVAERVKQARAILDFVAAAAPQRSTYAALLREEAALLQGQPDGYLFHEYLEHNNHPTYFYEFVQHVDAAGLQYLADTNLRTMLDNSLPAQARSVLQRISNQNLVQMEQYLDFIHNRPFRQSLFVHQSITVDRTLDWPRLRGLFVAAALSCTHPDFEAHTPDAVEFITPTGFKFSTAVPLIKKALQILMQRWPESIPFESLVAMAREGIGDPSPADSDQQQLGEFLLELFLYSAIELSVEPWGCQKIPSQTPRVTPLALWQLRNNEQLMNLRHQRVAVDAFLSRIIQLMDGNNTQEGIIDTLHKQGLDGVFQIRRDGRALTSPDEIRNAIAQDLPANLEKISYLSLLAG